MTHDNSRGNSFKSKRPSMVGRRSRQNSVLSVESSVSHLVDENTQEMYSGAASEIIPSSISSFHYPHNFRSKRAGSSVNTLSNEASPLLQTTDHTLENFDLHSVHSGSSHKSNDNALGFRFFLPQEIEGAPGGSTLENPEDPVDYNTKWDYSVDKYDDEEIDPLSREGTSALFRRGSRETSEGYDNESAFTEGEGGIGSRSSSESHFERRMRRDSEDSDKNDSSIEELLDDTVKEDLNFPASSEYQRFYLAEEDLVIGVAGYKDNDLKKALYYFFCILTLGMGYLVLRWLPKYRVSFMGDKTPLGKADWCVIENEYGELTIVPITKEKYDGRLSSFLNVQTEDSSKSSYSKQNYQERENDPFVTRIHSFTYRYLKFFYSPVEDIFKTNGNWYDIHWLNLKNTKDGISETTHKSRSQIFGKNDIIIDEKSVPQLLVDEVLHPFYIFQVFSIFLWLADNYYYYATCIFLISLLSIVNSLVETKSTLKRLKEMSVFSCEVRVWRNDFWTQINSCDLVPGDVFEVDPTLTVLPCDALLVNGECIVNESMLTGESVPVSKISASPETLQCLLDDFTTPKLAKSYLYNGTKLLKMKTSNDEPVTATVLKTGFNTTKGSLVRSMLFPKPTGFKFYQDSFKYIGFMTMIAFIGFTYSTYNFIQLGLPKRLMLLRALDIITIVVPPALPATLTIGTTFAVNRLRKKNIFCIAPTRVNIGGKLDVVCFDKTGTLTEDGLDVLGIHVAENAAGRKEIVFKDIIDDIGFLESGFRGKDHYSTNNSKYLLGAMAACHSLRLVDNELIGDPLDAKMFQFTKWNFMEEYDGPHSLVYPVYESEGYIIVREFEFISYLRRMSVVVRDRNDDTFIFTKGAPEVMSDICIPETLPENYEDILHRYTHQGFRVIALAYKELRDVKELSSLSREETENGLSFAGFIVFENKLKESTKPTLQKLNEANIRTVMCTGDNILTAVSVSRECELLEKSVQNVYFPVYQEGANETNLVWEDLNDSENKLDPILLKPLNSNIRNEVTQQNSEYYRLAITGDIFRYLLTEVKNVSLIQRVLMKCDIYARMSPDEKHELVEQLQKLDYTVGFCGDGANDCGALKAADVGVSLSEAEASVAAPFTSRVFEITCILDVIKEGRSSLVTSFSCFKYMSLYSAIQFVTVSIMYKRGINLGDFQFLYIDLFLILPLAIFMSWSKPYDTIVVKRPPANLVSIKVLIPMCCHILTLLVFQVALWLLVQQQPWYIKPVPGDDDDVQSFDNTILFLFSNFQYIFIAIVLSVGPPYREPVMKNVPFLVNVVVSTCISLALFWVDGDSRWGTFMQLTNLPTSFYYIIILAALANLALMYAGEDSWFVRLAKTAKRCYLRGKPRKSKKLFKNLRKEYVSLQEV
ncbi:Piso0_001096 [Millerozyma farinosa CBS 7064]|uniref:Cation-transporting ATPase n=1 Tax=Pichia sorbitophila (strain ATCC MYA-4447 / BCRC 22081 / CBS 7064 / NBRC 10061 / NRRL Y-12695) TaxID=559304 RepID=G8YQX4_PICSO|nr:Piso0_001096 [Millerozyma farinosa CBS 7064]CCE79059.1 Piso0_001096 [Millerozyma farinosa CBS 7064]